MPTTTSKRNLFILITALVLCAVIFFATRHSEDHSGKVFVHPVAVKLPAGWGYDIVAGERVYIHQTNIPGVAGNQAFETQEEALKTGRLVVRKMAHDALPTITLRDLDSLGISIKK